jgi:hypothetical protein
LTQKRLTKLDGKGSFTNPIRPMEKVRLTKPVCLPSMDQILNLASMAYDIFPGQ